MLRIRGSLFGNSSKYFFTKSIVILGATTIALAGCTKTLDTSKLENDIQKSITRQGGTSLKTVTCPKDLAFQQGKGFDCVGTLDSGETFTVPVTQTDAHGTTTWDVPNTRGLLNLAKLESLFQQTVRPSGQNLAIDCGRGYRSVQPGDRFECKVSKSAEKPDQSAKSDAKKAASQKSSNKKVADPKLPEVIVVTIDPHNNVNWQQVFPAAAAVQVASSKSSTPTKKSTPANNTLTQSSSAISPEVRAKLSPKVIKTLEQMGGGDME